MRTLPQMCILLLIRHSVAEDGLRHSLLWDDRDEVFREDMAAGGGAWESTLGKGVKGEAPARHIFVEGSRSEEGYSPDWLQARCRNLGP